MSNQIQCPNCGSYRTFPHEGSEDYGKAMIKGVWRGLTGWDPTFDNPKNFKKFQEGLIGAHCGDCQFNFDINTGTKNVSLPLGKATSQNSAEERLAHLEQLRNKKLITEEEYKQKREEIIRNL